MSPVTEPDCKRNVLNRMGAIQPLGVLLAVGAADARIEHCSENCAELLGRPAPELFGLTCPGRRASPPARTGAASAAGGGRRRRPCWRPASAWRWKRSHGSTRSSTPTPAGRRAGGPAGNLVEQLERIQDFLVANAVWLRLGAQVHALRERADRALYGAKHAGRGTHRRAGAS